jgi:hypothetical protein
MKEVFVDKKYSARELQKAILVDRKNHTMQRR